MSQDLGFLVSSTRGGGKSEFVSGLESWLSFTRGKG